MAAKRLWLCGSDFIAIPCNTVHYFHQPLQAAVNIPILNLITFTADKVAGDKIKSAGLLASASTNKLQLYQQALAAKNIGIIGATDAEQQIIDEIILTVMAGTNSSVESGKLQKIISRLKNYGAEAIILGCTELPLAISQAQSQVLLYDTLKILADKTLAFAYGK